jgi:hypothetical protein
LKHLCKIYERNKKAEKEKEKEENKNITGPRKPIRPSRRNNPQPN